MFKSSTTIHTTYDWDRIMMSLKRDIGENQQGYFDWEVRTGRATWDTKWAELFGLTPGAGSGNTGLWESTIHSYDVVEVLEKLNAHLSGLTRFFTADYRLNPQCGQPHSIRTYGLAAHRKPNGRPTRVLLTSHKIAALEYTKIRRYESPLSRNA